MRFLYACMVWRITLYIFIYIFIFSCPTGNTVLQCDNYRIPLPQQAYAYISKYHFTIRRWIQLQLCPFLLSASHPSVFTIAPPWTRRFPLLNQPSSPRVICWPHQRYSKTSTSSMTIAVLGIYFALQPSFKVLLFSLLALLLMLCMCAYICVHSGRILLRLLLLLRCQLM